MKVSNLGVEGLSSILTRLVRMFSVGFKLLQDFCGNLYCFLYQSTGLAVLRAGRGIVEIHLFGNVEKSWLAYCGPLSETAFWGNPNLQYIFFSFYITDWMVVLYNFSISKYLLK